MARQAYRHAPARPRVFVGVILPAILLVPATAAFAWVVWLVVVTS